MSNLNVAAMLLHEVNFRQTIQEQLAEATARLKELNQALEAEKAAHMKSIEELNAQMNNAENEVRALMERNNALSERLQKVVEERNNLLLKEPLFEPENTEECIVSNEADGAGEYVED